MKKLTILLFALLVFGSNEVFAWGSWAHRFIAYTADRYLEPEVKTKVEKYLGSPIIDHCVWMDQIRKPIRKKDHPNYEAFQAYRPSLRWHHMVVDKKFKVSDKRSKIGSGAMIPNLEKCIDNLKNYRNLPDSAVAVNLKYVIHRMQDMHCPSHIFYTEFPDCFEGLTPGAKSRGFMNVYYEGKKTSFHSIWDGKSLLVLYPEFGKDYEKFRQKLDTYNAKQRAKICAGSLHDWVSDAGKRCRPVYNGVEPGDELDRKFLIGHRKISEGQAMRSAYRLAYLLNEIFR
jgi:hypothetical protein